MVRVLQAPNHGGSRTPSTSPTAHTHLLTMSSIRAMRQEMLRSWSRIGTKFLPFADAASESLPLSRLLRLSLFQISVGMALVLMIGTLTRVMIV